MGKVNWKVKVKLSVKHQLDEMESAFGDTSLLKGVNVKVSARTKVLGKWGTWNKWGTETTGEHGRITPIEKKKKDVKRQFKIMVKFKSDDLTIFSDKEGLFNQAIESLTDRYGKLIDLGEDGIDMLLRQTARIGHKAHWLKVYQTPKDEYFKADDLSIFSLVFKKDGNYELGTYNSRAHADIWALYTKAMEAIKNLGWDLAFPKRVYVKYPHDNPIISDESEACYVNPYNHMIYIIKNGKTNEFKTDSLLHELMHLWAYRHCKNEKGMFSQLIANDFDLHKKLKKSFAAFHEGFAEYGEDYLQRMIFRNDPETMLPYNRKALNDGIKHFNLTLKMKSLDDMEHTCRGWWSALHMLTTHGLETYDIGTPNTTASSNDFIDKTTKPSADLDCSSPSLEFEDILRVFLPNESKGYKKEISKSEMNFTDFLTRAADVLDGFNKDWKKAYLILFDPSEDAQPQDELCNSGSSGGGPRKGDDIDTGGKPDEPRELRHRTAAKRLRKKKS